MRNRGLYNKRITALVQNLTEIFNDYKRGRILLPVFKHEVIRQMAVSLTLLPATEFLPRMPAMEIF